MMAQSGGYTGKILKVDLSSRTSQVVSSAPYQRFIGGRGFGARLYWEETPPGAGALGEENCLVFAVGPLAGVPAIGGSRWGIYGKSPYTAPEMFNYGNAGGHWGAELKFAGYDALVVRGRSDTPTCLVIRDDAVEFEDASDLMGLGAWRTRESIKKRLGREVKVAAIGPAGENLVTTAVILADNDATCSAGMGCVMGSKNLKAVAVRGTRRKTSVARPERLRELTGYLRSFNRGTFIAWGNDFVQAGPRVKRDPCYGCPGACIRRKYTAEDGATTKAACQSVLFYQAWAWKFYGRENEASFHASRLCNDYGLDSWFVEKALAWLLRLHRGGVPFEGLTGMPLSRLGSVEFIEHFVRMIALRQGFGDALARGLAEAAMSLGGPAPAMIKHSDPYDPRLYLTTALLWATEPREPIQALHEVGYPLSMWTTGVKGAAPTHVDSEAVRGIARRFWGSQSAADFTTADGKALAARMIQDRQYAKESLIVCDWIYPISDSRQSPDHVGDPTLESQLFSAVTGTEIDEAGLYRLGERVFNQQRAVLVRDGWRARQSDRLPDDWHDEPLKRGVMDPEGLVPDAKGRPVSRVGAVVGRQEFEKMKDEYYALRGWDAATGLQTRPCLEGLGLADVAGDLEQRGLLADGARNRRRDDGGNQ